MKKKTAGQFINQASSYTIVAIVVTIGCIFYTYYTFHAYSILNIITFNMFFVFKRAFHIRFSKHRQKILSFFCPHKMTVYLVVSVGLQFFLIWCFVFLCFWKTTQMVLRPYQIYENVYDYLYEVWLNSLIYISMKTLKRTTKCEGWERSKCEWTLKTIVENHENELTAI